MSTTALVVIAPAATEPIDLRLAQLRQMVLDSVVSENSKRNYAKALDALSLFAASRPLARGLLMEWRAAMDKLSPSTVNVRLSAMRKLVNEARRNGMLGAEEAANLTEVPNIPSGPTTCAKLCRKSGGDLEQIKLLLGHSSIQTTERYLGLEQDHRDRWER